MVNSHDRDVNDDDDDELSMSFVICLEGRQLVWNVLSQHPDLTSNWIMIVKMWIVLVSFSEYDSFERNQVAYVFGLSLSLCVLCHV